MACAALRGGLSSNHARGLEGLFSQMPSAGFPHLLGGSGRPETESPQGSRSHPGTHNLCLLPSFMPTALNLTCSYPGPELLCVHFRGLRKHLWKELLFEKRFYSRSCIPGKALRWPRLTDTTPILHKPSLPPSPPTLGSPSPFLLSRKAQWDQQGPDSPSFQIRSPQVSLDLGC